MDAKSDASSSLLLDQPVDYRDLKAWIEQQEQHPMPLTKVQQRAIADLKRSIQPENVQPETGNRDWVSIMNSRDPAAIPFPHLPTD
jgi:hypothetical protein